MNNSDSMGDKTENMGLQKIDMPTFDGSFNVKEKQCDILSNLEKEMCPNGDTSLQQHCDEFLKLMKTNPTTLTNGQTFPEGNEIINLERDYLLNHEEVIHMEENNRANDVDVSAENTVSYCETSEENRKKCLHIERRIDRLTRRLKLKQSKLHGLHTSEQIAGFIDFCRCKFNDLQQQQSNSHSTTSMDMYLKRLKRCSEQSCVPYSNDKYLNYFGSGSKETKNGRNIISSVAPKLTVDVHEHIEKISGQLHAQVKAIASDFDSDVTASSSGNDSLDEETPSLPTDAVEDRSKKIPLSKRAIWRWLRNRASIAYRLSWLQSNMSALEYKIHHYTEIYKKLRCTKGQVTLQNAADQGSACSTTSAGTKNFTSGTTAVLNGFHGSLRTVEGVTSPYARVECHSGDLNTGNLSCHESDDTCCRTCPLQKGKFRKRNLVRLDTMQPADGSNSTYAKYASVRCDCIPPMTCVLCWSRGAGVDLSNQHIFANLLSVQSKIALLEPTYHPVLSFPADVSVSTHISALLNNDDVLDVCRKTIENRTATQMAIKRTYANYKTTEEIRRANAEGIEFKRRRKYVRRQPNNSQTSYGRSQLLGKQRNLKLDKTLSFRKRRRKRLRKKRITEKDNGVNESPDEGLYYKKDDVYSSQPGSPHSSHSSTVKDPIRRKRGQSYDIDNFIIPPNSTPALVASKPQYKDILIPTWRVVEDRNLKLEEIDRSSLPFNILEDLNDDIVVKLHEILEREECKKFRTNTRSKTGRGRKRTDSCPETSEANTPERVASPISCNAETNDTSVSSSTAATVANNTITSNRTTASSNKLKIPPLLSKTTRTSFDCDNSSVTEPTSAEITPYERRKFPLSFEEYKAILSQSVTEEDAEHGEQETDNNSNDTKPVENESRVQSPLTESTDTITDDPDDPDWMLQDEELD